MLNELSCGPARIDPDAPLLGPFEDIVLMPMVITRIDDVHGCVSALSLDGRWVRPEPVQTGEVTGAAPYYGYRRSFHCRISASDAPDRRPEDRNLVRHLDLPSTVPALTEQQLQERMAANCDTDVNTAFAGERSVGLIEAVAERICLQRSTRQRVFVRLVFRDSSGASYDWMVPDVVFSTFALERMRDAVDPQQAAAPLLHRLQQGRLFLAVALTQPNNRFPGVFRGCQPLVGGVHCFPDYQPLSRTETEAPAGL